MSYEEFYKRITKVYENPEIDAEETCHWLGELIREFEAAQQPRAVDALRCEEEGCNEPAVMFYCEGHAP